MGPVFAGLLTQLPWRDPSSVIRAPYSEDDPEMLSVPPTPHIV